jgi:16S rRNA G966 N2-methylase RsmD
MDKTLLRIFPKNTNYNKLLIDNESIYYISIREVADEISNIILKNIGPYDSKDLIIVDATAGVGGNTLSFANYFKSVISIEINDLRYEYLKNNIEVYGFRNIVSINGDSIGIINDINNIDIIFFDPPWGGSEYKKMDNIRLCISQISLEEICCNLIKNVSGQIKMIVIKLPFNYDIVYFCKYFDQNYVNIYKLKKMMLIIIKNNKYFNS